MLGSRPISIEKYAILVEPGGAVGSETYISFSFKAYQAAVTRKCNSHQKYPCPTAQGFGAWCLRNRSRAGHSSRSPEDSRRRLLREYAPKGNKRITNPSTNFSMTQSKRMRIFRHTCLEVVGNEGTDWTEEVDQSKSLPGFGPAPTSGD
jgi:hypothetical protein